MRNFYITLVICIHSTFIQAQKNIPSLVLNAFNKQYIGATEIEWEKENEHTYEVTFIFKGADYSVNYDDTGNWLETEVDIIYSELPEKVRLTIEANENIKYIQEIAKIETAKGDIYFEVDFKNTLLPLKEKYYSTLGVELKK